MDWAAPLSTALGAVIGLSSAAFAERTRWAVGRDDRRDDALKAVYAAYLGALARAVEQIWTAARRQRQDWSDAALTALRDHNVQEARFELALSAPTNVVRQAELVADKLVSYREAVAGGAIPGHEPYERAWAGYYESREVMIGLMRSSLKAHG